MERNDTYWGLPEDDDAAIRELQRLQRRGAEYVVFGKPAFWWLDYYVGFLHYLSSASDCCYHDELLTVFELHNDTDSNRELA
jgi:hypothetical protein